MSDNSKIEWTDATWNCVTGCTKISPGCDHCYAETFAERWRGTAGHHFEHGFDVTLRPERLSIPLRWRKPRRVFVNSMSDVFHEAIPDDFIAQMFAIMALTPWHTYQVLTKRHGRMRSLLCSAEFGNSVFMAWDQRNADLSRESRWWRDWLDTHPMEWPVPNVWLGVSTEDQHWADIRIPALLRTDAAVRFVSAEPLVGPVDLRHHLAGYCLEHDFPGGFCVQRHHPGVRHLDWIIAGGESGPGARPMLPQWARQLRDQCQEAAVPFFFKQWGAWGPTGWIGVGGHDPARMFAGEVADKHGSREEIARVGKKAAGRILDGRTWDEFPLAAAGVAS